jgi:hypothetical protein
MSPDIVSDVLAQIGVVTLSNETALVLGLLFAALMLRALWRLGGGFAPSLRPIAAFSAVRDGIENAAENALPIHVSPGAGGLGDGMTAQTLAGLAVVQALAQPAATSGVRLLVSTASPLLLPIVEGMQRAAHAAAGYPQDYKPDQVRFLSDNRNAYAVGVARLVSDERAAQSILTGDFSDEYLLAAEPAAGTGVELIAGAGNPRTLPFVVATASHPLVGEELFVAGAYLSRQAAATASLLAQDQMRLLLIGMILAGVVLETLAGV